MPFVQVPDDNETTPIDLGARQTYTDRQTAFATLPPGHRVIYVPTDIETANWHGREVTRFIDGTYTRVPWADVDAYPLHFVHLSTDDPGKVAYTVDAENGYVCRKRRVTPGRYLDEFYPDVPRDQRLAWAAACIAPTFTLATTASEIESVYRSSECSSCMDGRHSFRIHPSRVYAADSDLAVAYLGPLDKATARSVVWPDEKRHTNVYGRQSDVLRHALQAAGYTRGDFDGARIRAIEHPAGGYVMPYVDGADSADLSECGTFFVLGDGPYTTKTQNGRSDDGGTCDHCGARCDADETYCESCHDARYTCEHCGDDDCFDEDHAPYCYTCDQERSYCDSCNENTWDGTTSALDRRGWDIEVCEDCARAYRFTCVHCGARDNETEYGIREQRVRHRAGTARVLCGDCVGQGVAICPDCETTRDDAAEPCGDCVPGVATADDLTAICEAS